jgi:hypothetical protein
VQVDHVPGVLFRAREVALERDALPIATALLGVSRARGVHEDLAHGARREPHEVPAAGDGEGARIGEPDVHLVHQSGGAQRMVGTLAAQTAAGELPQLVVDERHHAGRLFRVAEIDGADDGGESGVGGFHGANVRPAGWGRQAEGEDGRLATLADRNYDRTPPQRIAASSGTHSVDIPTAARTAPMTRLGRIVLVIALTVGSAGPTLGQATTASAPVDSAHLAWAKKLLEVGHAQQALLVGFDSAFAAQRQANEKKGAQIYFDSLAARARRELPQLVDSVAVVWAGQLSVPDLQQLVDFFQTPLGQRYASAQVGVGLQSQGLAQRWGMRLALDVMRDLVDKGLINPADLRN